MMEKIAAMFRKRARVRYFHVSTRLHHLPGTGVTYNVGNNARKRARRALHKLAMS